MSSHQLDPADLNLVKYGHGPNPVIEGYQILPEALVVKFHQPSKSGTQTYVYTQESVGETHLAAMKELALANDGLLSYINRHVRKNFSEKW